MVFIESTLKVYRKSKWENKLPRPSNFVLFIPLREFAVESMQTKHPGNRGYKSRGMYTLGYETVKKTNLSRELQNNYKEPDILWILRRHLKPSFERWERPIWPSQKPSVSDTENLTCVDRAICHQSSTFLVCIITGWTFNIFSSGCYWFFSHSNNMRHQYLIFCIRSPFSTFYQILDHFRETLTWAYCKLNIYSNHH